jgi:hypothetical protein
MNWGYKILIVYAVFVSGIMFLVFKSSSQKVDLVTTDYYAKELKYQQQLDAMDRVDRLSETVKYQINDEVLTIVFPKDFTGQKVTGDVVLYCPWNEDRDLKQNFSIQDTSLMLPLRGDNKGLYELQLSWQANSISYYFEKKLILH